MNANLKYRFTEAIHKSSETRAFFCLLLVLGLRARNYFRTLYTSLFYQPTQEEEIADLQSPEEWIPNPYLARIYVAWPSLKMWEKASIYVRAMYWAWEADLKKYWKGKSASS